MDNKLKKLITDFILDAKDEDGCQIQGLIDGYLLENKFNNNEDLYYEDDYKTRDEIVDKIVESILKE
jgi:hypothetical protein